MATTGTNYTAKWELVDGVLTISPVSGNSGEMRGPWHILTPEAYITKVIDMTDEEWNSVTSIVFVGDITIKAQDAMGYYYCYVANLFTQMGAGTLDVASIPNVTSIDVRGLNTTNCESFSNMFYRLTSLTEIIGIDTLNMSAVTDYSGMFEYTKLSELDLSSFSNMNTAKISSMIMAMNYLSTLTLPSNFSRTSPLLNNQDATYQGFGIANSQIYATNSQTQVTISSDNDFFALETGQGGTWIRHISGSATLSFKITSVQRDGNNATVSYSYATSTATAYVYIKESSASSFPQSPTETISLAGSGNGTLNLTLATDSSYEMQFIVSDGETNLYVFASIDSNALLLSLSDSGRLEAAGDIVSGDNIFMALDTTAASGTTDGDLYAAINSLGWQSYVIV